MSGTICKNRHWYCFNSYNHLLISNTKYISRYYSYLIACITNRKLYKIALHFIIIIRTVSMCNSKTQRQDVSWRLYVSAPLPLLWKNIIWRTFHYKKLMKPWLKDTTNEKSEIQCNYYHIVGSTIFKIVFPILYTYVRLKIEQKKNHHQIQHTI